VEPEPWQGVQDSGGVLKQGDTPSISNIKTTQESEAVISPASDFLFLLSFLFMGKEKSAKH
jgi:hypothetical protein